MPFLRAVKGSLGRSSKERCRELDAARSTRAFEDRQGCPVERDRSERGKCT